MIRLPRAWTLVGPRRTSQFQSRILHRGNATKPPTMNRNAPATTPLSSTVSTKTIPGPSWLWLEPIYVPFRAYGRVQQKRPYVTQFISALVIYFLGDLVAQEINKDASSPPLVLQKDEGLESQVEKKQDDKDDQGIQRWVAERDWSRTGRALVIGGLAAVPGYRWFLWLGQSFNYGSKALSLSTKVMVNQLLFTPLFNTYFFGMQSFLSGSSPPEILERIQHTVPPSWINSCKIWPAVTAFSFTFVPVMYRSIFGGVIAIGWQTYLSLLNARAQEVEEVEHAHAHENQHENKHENKKRAVKRCTKVEGRDRRRVAA